jgi:hypothetical protein
MLAFAGGFGGKFMRHILLSIGVYAGLFGITACSGEMFTPEAKRADAIKTFNLTTAQIDIMDAYYQGISKDDPEPAMSRRWTRIAACYASQIEIADKYDIPHRDYIRDFAAVEKEYYEWFQRRGIGQDAAYDLGERVRKTSDKCHKIIRR